MIPPVGQNRAAGTGDLTEARYAAPPDPCSGKNFISATPAGSLPRMSTSAHWWTELIDDAAALVPGVDPSVAVAQQGRRTGAAAALVRGLVVREVDLPALAGVDGPVSIVLGGGAAQLEGALKQAAKLSLRVGSLTTVLRDLDDLGGNARRVTRAVEKAESEGVLSEDTAVYVEMPPTPAQSGWLDAADELAAMGLGLRFRTGGPDAAMFPSSDLLSSWVDAALDRETPFNCAGGLDRAVRRTSCVGVEQHGFLNLALATVMLFDGDPAGGRVLEERDSGALLDLVGQHDLTRARRWFASFSSEMVSDAYDDLVALGVISD